MTCKTIWAITGVASRRNRSTTKTKPNDRSRPGWSRCSSGAPRERARAGPGSSASRSPAGQGGSPAGAGSA
eukprot:11175438-Lingulodinium_polyedra.AAC.1